MKGVITAKDRWETPEEVFRPLAQEFGFTLDACAEESERGVTVVALIPAATSSRWFHGWVYGKAELRFLSRRVKFVGGTGPAPFHSLVAVYRGAKGK